MYKSGDKLQSSFLDFDQPMGLHMNPNNRWIKMADTIPWDEYEKKYRRLFKSKTGNVAKPFRMALVSDGTLWEVLTALYFRWTCLPDCAVPELDADYRRNNRRLS